MFYIQFKKKIIEKISESLIFAHFLFFGEQCEWIAHFTQIKWAMWANRSGRSPKMSDHERFAQVAHQKWANEWITHFFERIAHSLIFGQKRAICLEIKWANSQPCRNRSYWQSTLRKALKLTVNCLRDSANFDSALSGIVLILIVRCPGWR